ncbi:MAG: 2-C-methyl-D-erythritol 4-phosphate cytidylyltransferase [Muribaculaceae bacterium]|nr:2-C-methyl-D-erythritol 4-phosphate cytidylyltransferase [Muribaculaceae bacterium]
MKTYEDTHIIIVAAGTGSRFGSSVPKQFCLLQGRSVVMHAIDALRQACPGAQFTLVLSESEHPRWRELCATHGFESPTVVYGGSTRFESVRNALALTASEAVNVMVHDGARPMPSMDMIHQLFYTLDTCQADGALPALAVTDSLRTFDLTGEQLYTVAVDRSLYRTVQTPQLFPAHVLLDAYDRATPGVQYTDDASVAEGAGYTRISLSPGSRTNIKITNPGDIELAEFYMSRR